MQPPERPLDQVTDGDLDLIRTGVRQSSSKAYDRERKAFMLWRAENRLMDPSLHLDVVLNRYIVHLWKTGGRTTKGLSKAKQAHAAMVQFSPHLRGQLHLSLCSLRAWKKNAEVDSHPPMPYEVMCHLVNHFFANEKVELALLVWALFDGLGRVSELLDRRLSAVLLPGEDTYRRQSEFITVILDTTKTRPKTMHLRDKWLVQSLTLWVKARRRSKSLFLFETTYSQVYDAFGWPVGP